MTPPLPPPAASAVAAAAAGRAAGAGRTVLPAQPAAPLGWTFHSRSHLFP